ncbi:hypothetical protein B0H15DRAFT_957525 [Mycena belliarum]|uniref:Uncharacterized protein n=1 Tax=Mycena belliarum TaxID=1033014 RepID=A0AAD6TNG6_9AGAR|nr:hypothetical protein B0H15DRAFT_957525 [Mycena belliae]
MPVVNARDTSTSSGPNVGLIVGILFLALISIGGLVALLLLLLKKRRAAHGDLPETALEGFMGGKKSYLGHHKSDSTGPLIQRAPTWEPPADRQIKIPRTELPLPPYNGGSSGEEDFELGPQVPTDPTRYARAPPPRPRVGISQAPPFPSTRLYQPRAASPPPPASPVSAASTASLYSESSTSRMHTPDLVSPPPPVPALPAYLRPPPHTSPILEFEPSPTPPPLPTLTNQLRSELPPEAAPLTRGATRAVADLLKKRAKRAANDPTRSLTYTSRIERADSIWDAPSPADEPIPPLPRPTNRVSTATVVYDYYTRTEEEEGESEQGEMLEEYYDEAPLDADTLDYYTWAAADSSSLQTARLQPKRPL